MMKSYIWLGVCLLLAAASGAAAQGVQTGELGGRVTTSDRLSLPGATVTVSSASLQGVRSATTDRNGVYVITMLPPGTYRVTFEFDAAQSMEEMVTVPLGGRTELDASMTLAGIEESVTVVAEIPTPLATPQTSANLTNDVVDTLATGRTLSRIAELAPGLTSNTLNNRQVTIAGAFGYDNVFMVDGVDVNDNLFGRPDDLFIEDAIEETQVLTSGISAEYGRFSGGVVNAITKSGGNDVSGSFRANFTNPSWSAETPFEQQNDVERESDLSKYFEGTLGGPIVRDRLWFFFASRNERSSQSGAFPETGVPINSTRQNDRYEVKLTGTAAQNHTVRGSYLRTDTDLYQATFPFTIDPAGIIAPTTPNRLFTASYDGVLNSELMASVKVSRKEYGVRGLGGTSTSIVDSPFLTFNQAFAHYNAPYFDATDPEDRDNQQVSGSLTYFAATAGAGTHELKGGGEYFVSTHRGGNSQSSTGYVFDADYLTDAGGAPVLDASGHLVPVFAPFNALLENWLPERGSKIDIKTTSLYLQDRWSANPHWSFDLGMRYEHVTSADSGGIDSIDTNALVPRLGATYDIGGDGRYVLQSTYGHYVGRYNEYQFANNTNVGNPNALFGIYTGPAGSGRDFAPGFDPSNYAIIDGFFPVSNVFFEDGLSAPRTREVTVSGGATVGRRGHVKLTYVNRAMSNFVEDFITIEDGSTLVSLDGTEFGTFQNRVYRNTDALSRDYQALILQGTEALTDRWSVSGHWTVEIENNGNFEGEARNQPGVGSPFGNYPEIFTEARHYPTGPLNGFQRHKVRLWSVYSQSLGRFGDMDMAGLWRYNGARRYSVVALNQPLTDTQRAIAETAGYDSLPRSQSLYFGPRGSQSFDGYGLLDLAVTYSLPVWQTVRPWLKVELFNALGNDALVAWNTTVAPDPNSPTDELGLPTGYVEGPRFGQGTSTLHYPTPLPDQNGGRTFQMAFGVRF